MRKILVLILSLLIVTAVMGIGTVPVRWVEAQEESPCAGIVWVEAWARPSPMVGGNAAIYGFLLNPGEEDDTLLSAELSVAKTVELHETMMLEGDVMQMQPVAGGIVIPAGGYAQLKPGGLHIMLIETTEEIMPGMMLEAKLNFEQAGELVAMVPVRDLSGEMPGMSEMDGMSEATEMPMLEATGEATEMPEMSMGNMDPHAAMPFASNLRGNCAGFFVVDAYARPTLLADGNGAVFGLLVNIGMEDDRLVSATTEVAGTTEIHETTMEGDVMQMRPLTDGLPVPAMSYVTLARGGLHVMLIGVPEVLEIGDSVELTLTFEKSGVLTLTVPVEERDMGEMESMQMGQDN